MRLAAVDIEGYRSVRDAVHVDIDDRVTVFLGPNDHGKSNLLEALLHLNPDTPFGPDDRNWDCSSSPDLPRVTYTIRLEPSDMAQLASICQRSAYLAELKEAELNLDQTLEELQSSGSDVGETVEFGALEVDEHIVRPSVVTGEEAQMLAKDEQRLRAERDEAEAALALVRGAIALFEATDAQVDSVDLRAEIDDVRSTVQDLQADFERAEERERGLLEEAEEATVATTTSDEAAALREKVDEAGLARTEAEELHAVWNERLGDLERAHALLGEDQILDSARLPAPPQAPSVQSTLILCREGLDSELLLKSELPVDSESFQEYLTSRLPRIELITSAQISLADSVTLPELTAAESDFMRGIFYYAGLERTEWENLFTKDDRTSQRLDDANEVLNTTIRSAWSQGSQLVFELDHHGDEIELRLKDPAVRTQKVRVSRRSSGFTNFFALTTILNARRHERPADSYIWLFDEPGIYLHPQGQYDLLRSFEAIALDNQVLYTTHSLFMLNKSYPARHRLVKKSDNGTTVDQKPYVGGWRAAMDALGLSLPGTILFASKVLLVEGDADPILLMADLQHLVEIGEMEVDLNPLSIMATSDSQNADVLIRVLMESNLSPEVALLFDADPGGKARYKAAVRAMEIYDLRSATLSPADTEVEDHLLAPDLYRQAVIAYCTLLAPAYGKEIDEFESKINDSWSAHSASMSFTSKWAQRIGSDLLGVKPSKVGFAREYARLLTEHSEAAAAPTQRSVELAKTVSNLLSLDPTAAARDRVLDR